MQLSSSENPVWLRTVSTNRGVQHFNAHSKSDKVRSEKRSFSDRFHEKKERKNIVNNVIIIINNIFSYFSAPSLSLVLFWL